MHISFGFRAIRETDRRPTSSRCCTRVSRTNGGYCCSDRSSCRPLSTQPCQVLTRQIVLHRQAPTGSIPHPLTSQPTQAFTWLSHMHIRHLAGTIVCIRHPRTIRIHDFSAPVRAIIRILGHRPEWVRHRHHIPHRIIGIRSRRKTLRRSHTPR